jgi:hypothetical protein
MGEQIDFSGQKRRVLVVAIQDVLARYGVPAADNTTLLLMGRVHHGGSG